MTSSTLTTKQVLATSPSSYHSRFDHCFLVYPLPSIADESFLKTIFRCEVRRSIFSGFGRHRFAIVELDDTERAMKISLWLSHRLMEEKGAGGDGANQPSVFLPSGDDDRTLAQIVEDVVREQAVKSNNTVDFDYLSNLTWTGRGRIHIAPSPFAIQELFDCGGVVPQNKAIRGRNTRQVEKREARVKREPERVAVLPPDDVPPSRLARTEGGESSGTATFPKNCCQKCGSPVHFTRHCDGSGAPAVAEAVEQTEVRASDAVEKKTLKREEAGHLPPPPPRASRVDDAGAAGLSKKNTFVRTSKDQCKHCGSEEHLSRHCPNK
ncbi:unnamed protein product [Phytomonas sp. EM1]|nr:unnamed protein product [Phytomonas sp. EM1]|eukprot:CCW64184.1 unnamed protein product [Phytomonas sp. isolate EM1]